jgi:hypothetical protein
MRLYFLIPILLVPIILILFFVNLRYN